MSEQTVAEILRKVQRIQIVANRSVNDLLAGQYRSVFRGRGMEFDEVREYQPGDEIRTIDWNVTARAGAPFVKRFSEEREMTVLFLLDVSASGAFGSGRQSKLDVMVEMVALLMFSALKNNDKVGLLLFSNAIERYYPPRKGRSNVLRLIREMIAIPPVSRETQLDTALQFLNRVQKRRAVVFLISDFQAVASRQALALTHRRHDLVAMTVSDPRERELPNVGFLNLRDAETGEIVEVDTRHPRVRDLFREQTTRRAEQLSSRLRRTGIDELKISTQEPYTISLKRFFESREKRFH
ncbi:MAG: DUF58 domain-containing protein [Planctomycetales bacterium]|jgi:uncharacterized protein (DUF58 family)|nr:DUF58 domain-containing protein [Planctomycetales bacterium]